jgi:hypothetical protein
VTVGFAGQTLAAALYLLPVLVVLLWRCRYGNVLRDMVAWIPAAVSLDLLLCLGAARLAPLAVILLASRIGYLAIAVALVRARRPHFDWRFWPARQLIVILASGLAACLVSMSISRPYSIWDRQFHVPLVSMMRDQRVPFLTVFQPRTVLHFHFAGDVVAAALQVFSFGRLHSSLALALAHDVMAGLVGVSLAAWLTTLAPARPWIVLGVFGVLLSGPFALQRVGLGSTTSGYSYLNLLTMSYRPSISIAILLVLGGFGALCLRIAALRSADFGRSVPSRHLPLAFVASLAVLSISDEPSAALLGLAVFAVWLVEPEILHARRKVGVLVLVALALSILLSNLAFDAALVPGGPVQKMRLVPWRSPGFADPPLSLGTWRGLVALGFDAGPFALILVGAVGAWWTDRTGELRSVAVALALVLAAALWALVAVDLNGMAMENHRFMTICEVIFPCAGLVLLAQLPAGRWERLPLIGALGLSVVSTLHWYQAGFGNPDDWFTNSVDCRASAGARLFESPRPTYIPRTSLYAFAGCRPVFVPGNANANAWSGILSNGYPVGGREALASLDRDFVTRGEKLQVACPVEGWQGDRVCAYIAATAIPCRPAGSAFRTCELTGADRLRLLEMPW